MLIRLLTITAILFLSLVPQVATAQTKSIQDLVETQYLHGFPRGAEKILKPSDIPYLASVIGDKGKSKFWGNAISALAKINDERVTSLFVAFFAGLDGPLSPDEFRAAAIVPSVLSARSKNNPEIVKALEDLAEGRSSAYLPIRFYEADRSIDLTRQSFRKIAVFSLGYSPSPEALRYLESAKDKASPALAETYRSAIERAQAAGAAN